MGRDRSRWLAAFLALAAGCSSPTAPTTTDCSATTTAEAQSQVAAALDGNTNCDVGDDCVLAPTPCKVFGPCGFALAAVSAASLPSVQHAFSVTAAEVCGSCTPQLTDTVIDTDGCTNSPGATCVALQCAVVSFPPNAGSFEWDCVPTCFSGAYCQVEEVMTACPGLAGYVVVSALGTCLTSNEFSSPCQKDDDCGLGFACDAIDGGGGTCGASCPRAEQPTGCSGGCQLTSNNHACNICFCPNGCPLPDAG